MAAPETLKEWNVVITSVRQGYEFTKQQQDYRTVLEIMYGGQGALINIGNTKDNFKDEKSKCFNCNIYRHIVKDCKKPRKEQNTRKCYKYEKIGHITKDCKTKQKMKNRSI